MEISFTKSPYTRGLESVNRKFGKPDIRDLIVLFGFMSSGKTNFTYYVARKNIELGIKVCYVSLELPEYDMKLRIARQSAGVGKNDFQNGNYDDNQKAIMEIIFEGLNKQEELHIIKPENSEMGTIMKTCREYYDMGCRLFIIDNLDKINGDSNDNTRYQNISSQFQDFKNENNCAVILIHHAKKPSNKQFAYSPAGMSGLRGSQKILDNATQVIEIYRDLDPDITDEDKKVVTLYQYKDTFEGSNGYVEILFDKGGYVEKH